MWIVTDGYDQRATADTEKAAGKLAAQFNAEAEEHGFSLRWKVIELADEPAPDDELAR